jgi:hypothetical protein
VFLYQLFKQIGTKVAVRVQIWFARAHCFASGEGCSSGSKVVLAPAPPADQAL